MPNPYGIPEVKERKFEGHDVGPLYEILREMYPSFGDIGTVAGMIKPMYGAREYLRAPGFRKEANLRVGPGAYAEESADVLRENVPFLPPVIMDESMDKTIAGSYGPSEHTIRVRPRLERAEELYNSAATLTHENVHARQKGLDSVNRESDPRGLAAVETVPILEMLLADVEAYSRLMNTSPPNNFPVDRKGFPSSHWARYMMKQKGVRPGMGDVQGMINERPEVRQYFRQLYRKLGEKEQ